MFFRASQLDFVEAEIRRIAPEWRGTEVVFCEGFFQRFFGGVLVQARPAILVIPNCRSIHTIFGPLPESVLFLSLSRGVFELIQPSRRSTLSRSWADVVVEFFGQPKGDVPLASHSEV